MLTNIPSTCMLANVPNLISALFSIVIVSNYMISYTNYSYASAGGALEVYSSHHGC